MITVKFSRQYYTVELVASQGYDIVAMDADWIEALV